MKLRVISTPRKRWNNLERFWVPSDSQYRSRSVEECNQLQPEKKKMTTVIDLDLNRVCTGVCTATNA